MELAYLGKPAIALPQNDMERIFLKCFEKCGYIMPGLESCFDVMSEEPAIRLFRDSSRRLSAAKVGMKLIDGNGIAEAHDLSAVRAVGDVRRSGGLPELAPRMAGDVTTASIREADDERPDPRDAGQLASPDLREADEL